MRRLLTLAISSVLLTAAAVPIGTAGSPPESAGQDKSLAADARATWIVSFAEPPLASYRGQHGDAREKSIGLAATSPAVTGARRLDVKSAPARDYRKFLDQRRSEHLASASALLGRTLEPGFVYDVVNHAVTLSLTAGEAARLATLPGVADVERETIKQMHTDAGPGWIGAPAVWQAADGLATRGEGIVVGVIDSGINRTHPSFAATAIDGFTHGNPRGQLYGTCSSNAAACTTKLIGIHDFTICSGSHSSSSCDDREVNDGSDPDGHGSHVASTAVGNPLDTTISLPTGTQQTVRISGVAPRANLIAYKACEEEETCRGSWLLAAINQAVADGVDVVNFSIGSGPGDPWSDTDSQAMLSAREANVLFISSAGNDGPGASTVGSPADSPWVVAVAATTHDRAIANRLVDLAGGATPPPGGGVLLGTALTAGYGPAPLVVPADHPGCSQGTDLDSPPSGISNPWTAGRFSGEIVVCQRGTQARVAKSNNVKLAGGGGMVLVNQLLDGESTAVDQHGIPSTHLGYTAGLALGNWLATGAGHTGRIEGAQLLRDPSFGDKLASFSSRGPIAAGNLVKPTLSAPGSNVLAAAGSGTGTAFLSGTSMASPHVAGAFALLQAAHPSWTPTDIESALMTTAQPLITLSDNSAATVNDQGSGRIDLARALRAGLSFPITRAQFLAVDPDLGGDPRQLNQPVLLDDDCFERCSFSRRVRDIAGGGTWRADVVAPAGLSITVTPQQFTLPAGAEQTLQFDAEFTTGELIGQDVEAEVVLSRVGGDDVTPARVPVALHASPGNLPAQLTVPASAERGHADVGLSGLVALDDLRITTTPLFAPTVWPRALVEDPTPDERYDNIGLGSTILTVEVAAGVGVQHRFSVTTRSPTSPDVDLFVGVDLDGDDVPDEDEQLCMSAGPDASEACVLHVAGASVEQTIWVLVQNYDAGPGGNDEVISETLLSDTAAASDGSLTVTGPSSIARAEAFSLRVGWDEPRMLGGQSRIGYAKLAIGDNPPFAVLPVTIARSAGTGVAARALVPGAALDLDLPAGVAQDRLFIDVPANASALVLQTQSVGAIDLYAARTELPGGPDIAAAPARAAAQASAVGAGGSKSLRVSGATLQPGRWYVTPVNTGTAATTVTLTTTLEYAAPRATVQGGAYFNPARSGAGAFVYESAGSWALIWYTFLQDGTPTWYLGAAPAPGPQQGVWRVPLDRYVWNGSEAIPTTVGEAVLSLGGSDAFQFSWNLDGRSGSETYQRIDTGACPTQGGAPLDANGIWFSPDKPGFGYSISVGDSFESVAAYAYDENGVARWLFGGLPSFGGSSATIPLSAYVGFCPECDYVAPLTIEAGTMTRRYDDGDSGNIAVEFTLPAPLSGSWSVDMPATRLTESVGCP